MMPTLQRVTVLQSLGHRPFALLWTGQTLSRIGDYMYEVALAWWVLQKTGSATAMGLVLVCALSPMLLFLLIGGVAGDRLPRVRVMFLSDVGRGLLVGGVAVLAATGQLAIWHVYIASVLFGFVDAFFQPAYTAAVPDLTPAAVLPSANALTGMSLSAGRIIGPGVGAALVAWGGPAFAFGLNAVSFFVAAALLVPLRGHRQPAPAPVAEGQSAPGILSQVREAFGTVRANPVLWLPIAVLSFTNIALAGPYSVSLPFLVSNHLHADVGLLGFLYTMFPIGYLLGGLWMGRHAQLHRRGPLLFGALVVGGAGIALFGATTAVIVLAGAALINGAALEIGGLAWISTMQERTPRDQLGRVASIELLGTYALLPVGYALAGILTASWGPAPVFLLGGLATALVAGLALLAPAVRALD